MPSAWGPFTVSLPSFWEESEGEHPHVEVITQTEALKHNISPEKKQANPTPHHHLHPPPVCPHPQNSPTHTHTLFLLFTLF